MDPNNHGRCQPTFQSLRQKTKHDSLQDWHHSWNGKPRGRRDASAKDVNRHKPRLSSEPGTSDFKRTSSPANSVAHSLPNQPSRKESSEPLTSQLPMPDHLARLAAKLQPSPEAIDQIEDIFLLHPDVPTERPSSPRFQIGHYDSGGEHHVVPGVSSYAHTEGQLERYFAQDDYVPNAADDQNTNESFLRLRSLRANALRTRSLLRTKRKLLQDKQSAKAAADEAFMRYVREHVSASEFTTLSTKSDTLDQLFNNMQETRDMFGPLQNEYDEIEETLDDMEFEMAMIEGRIHKDTTISSPETPSQDRQKDPIGKASPLAPSSFMDFGSDSTEDYHPLHAQYLCNICRGLVI